MKPNKEIIDICRHIQQAIANSKSQFKSPELKVTASDYGEIYKNFKINDAFNVRIVDNKLFVTYQIETANPLIPKVKFEQDSAQRFSDFISHLKDEYKKLSDKTITLKQVGECKEKIDVLSYLRQIRTYINVYEIGGVPSKYDQEKEDVEEYRDQLIKDHSWLYKKKK